MHSQWEYAWLSVWHIISQQRCEIEQWFQRTTYRNLHIRSPMVTWLMTSRDPERSKSWPQNLWSSIPQQACEIHRWFILTTNRKPHIASPMVMRLQWSRDRWRHVTPKIMVTTQKVKVVIRYLWSLIFQKQREKRSWLKLTINRIPHIRSPMVT